MSRKMKFGIKVMGVLALSMILVTAAVAGVSVDPELPSIM